MNLIKPENKKALFNIILSAFIPCIILGITMILTGASPFGDASLIFRDADIQYIDFLSYAKTIINGENDIFYSFSKGMGGDMISLAAYYLLSPFNLLFALSSYGNIHLIFSIVAILKLACAAASFYFMSSRIYGNKLEITAFSTAYALMAYNIVYIWNLMWLDAMIVLPLVALGIYKIFREKKYALYCLSLTYALFTNYYTGFMLCISSVLMFLVMLILDCQDKKTKGIIVAKYFLSSAIAGFSTSFIWFPALLSMRTDRASFNNNDFLFDACFDFQYLFSSFTPGIINFNLVDLSLPNIFCTTVVLFLAILFFTNKEIEKSKKITAGGILLIIVLSFYIKPLNTIWHGFSSPNGFNFRYSFVFSFLLIFIAQYTYFKYSRYSRQKIVVSTVVLLSIFTFVFIKKYDFTSGTGISLCFIFLFLTFLLFNFKTIIPQKIFSLLFVLLCVTEAGCGTILTLYKMTYDVGCLNVGEHHEITESSTQALEYVKQSDNSFYRMEKLFRRSSNDPMFFDYNGLSHFSSSDNSFVMEFIGKMGLRNNDIWYYFNTGSTNEAESLLGLKYLIGGEDISQYKNYELYWSDGKNNIYKNNSVLPMAYLADNKITSLSMENEDYFQLHNEIWSAILGKKEEILSQEENFHIILNNVTKSTNNNGDSVYTAIDKSKPASVIYEIEISENKPIYYYFTAPEVQLVNIYINGQDNGPYFWIYRWDMSPLGVYKAGDKVRLELMADHGSTEITVSDEFFYYENLDKLKQVSGEINSQDINIIRHKDRHLSGSFNAEKNSTLIFSIPYNDGWTVKVDGEKVDTIMVMDALLAIEAEPGEHSYELKYTPVGFNAALAISTAAVLTAIVWFILEKRKK